MERIINIILYVLLAITLVLAIAFYVEGPDPADHPANDPPIFGDLMIRYSYLLLGAVAILALVFPVISMAKNPKNAVKPLAGVGVIAVILGIGYGLADGSNPSLIELSASGAQLVGMGLYAFYMLAGVALTATVYSEVAKFFK